MVSVRIDPSVEESPSEACPDGVTPAPASEGWLASDALCAEPLSADALVELAVADVSSAYATPDPAVAAAAIPNPTTPAVSQA
jgi:hypothetical protein